MSLSLSVVCLVVEQDVSVSNVKAYSNYVWVMNLHQNKTNTKPNLFHFCLTKFIHLDKSLKWKASTSVTDLELIWQALLVWLNLISVFSCWLLLCTDKVAELSFFSCQHGTNLSPMLYFNQCTNFAAAMSTTIAPHSWGKGHEESGWSPSVKQSGWQMRVWIIASLSYGWYFLTNVKADCVSHLAESCWDMNALWARPTQDVLADSNTFQSALQLAPLLVHMRYSDTDFHF